MITFIGGKQCCKQNALRRPKQSDEKGQSDAIAATILEHQIIYILYLLSFVETPRKFIIAELSIRKLGSSSVLIILILLALMKIRAYGSKALQ